ncbi:atp-dependent dna helicase like protein recg [Quercus suber]|uniref:Atp-dependent dna helicase like protein recg n=1 Tax=Quercus suber TaxID=58331 RepID=A0AAW0L0T1_QUESU
MKASGFCSIISSEIQNLYDFLLKKIEIHLLPESINRVTILYLVFQCYYGKGLRSAIVFEAERGYRNALGRKMRFNKFVLSKISKLCSRQKHELAGHLLAELARVRISDGSKYLEKVSAMMDYDSLHDSIDNGSAKKQTGMNHKDAMDEVDVSLACKRFPSIILGRSPKVELYNETTHCSEMSKPLAAQNCEGFVPNLVDAEWVQEGSSETWRLLSGSLIVTTSSKGEKDSYKPLSPPNHPIVTTSSKGEKDSHKPLSPRPMTLETVEKSDDLVFGEESSNKVGPESPVNAASIESFLNSSINCIPGLSKRHCRQLDNCGFHTLRKLLHHFPRTYADLQNAQTGIDDGQYLIFIGKILSSRGIRASYSFSFLEVVVGCEIAENQSNPEHTADDVGSKEKKTIYLHLKKFFRGSRFTFQPFLKSLEAKHKEGEIVCVSGKVRSMRSEGHFEMREYNIDVIQEEQDSSFQAKGRPYPIYPSKGGINPIFLRDTIARALQALPVNIDPIPKDITQDFKLLTLHDAYIGIHQPKNINEADLARKRLIFDEFFYLQVTFIHNILFFVQNLLLIIVDFSFYLLVTCKTQTNQTIALGQLGRLYQMLEGLGTKIEKDDLLDRYRKPELNSIYMEEWSSLTKKFLKALPYSLTSSQLNAVSEIIWDLKRPIPMNRLLQGDVGCGKTVVAFLACMEVIGSGYQGAFMVPSELLAIQHYEHLLNLLEKMEEVECKPSVALLTGSTPSKQSRMIRSSNWKYLIGHCYSLQLYYTSESSRMGANNLDEPSKGDEYMAPHVLAMSATPIPRTLALALYGDMSLTQITDLPPGRIPVETFIIEGNDNGFENVYKVMVFLAMNDLKYKIISYLLWFSS